MTRVMTGTRRALVLAGLATATAAALTACSAGQVTQTSTQVAAVPGFSISTPVPNFGSVGVRNAQVVFKAGGYARGSDAPLQLFIYNQTASPIDVQISSSDAASVSMVGKASGIPQTPVESASPSAAATSASPSAKSTAKASASASTSTSPSPAASPSASPSPVAPPAKPAKLTINAASFATLAPGSGTYVVLHGLTRDVRPGENVRVTFTFSNGATLENLPVPFAIPLTPLPRSPLEGLEPTE